MCDQCHEEHRTLKEMLEAHAQMFESHVQDEHAVFVTEKDVDDKDAQIYQVVRGEFEELAEEVLGPMRSEIFGGGRIRNKGIAGRVENIEAKLNNGGVGLKPGERIALYTTALGVVGAIIVALIQAA